MNNSEQDQKNRELVESLRKAVEGLMQRLTPQVEPAVVYVMREDAE